MTTPHKQTYAEMKAAAERAEKAAAAAEENVQPAEAPKPHPDVERPYNGQPTSHASDDVPGWWVRCPTNGVLNKIPNRPEKEANQDTLKRCLRDGFALEDDPRVTGNPIFGKPWKTPNSLA